MHMQTQTKRQLATQRNKRTTPALSRTHTHTQKNGIVLRTPHNRDVLTDMEWWFLLLAPVLCAIAVGGYGF
jgi:hypothetical protein